MWQVKGLTTALKYPVGHGMNMVVGAWGKSSLHELALSNKKIDELYIVIKNSNAIDLTTDDSQSILCMFLGGVRPVCIPECSSRCIIAGTVLVVIVC